MEHPPPVPVTQPNVQNFAHSDGMRFAGWLGSAELTSVSGSLSDARSVEAMVVVGVCKLGSIGVSR